MEDITEDYFRILENKQKLRETMLQYHDLWVLETKKCGMLIEGLKGIREMSIEPSIDEAIDSLLKEVGE